MMVAMRDVIPYRLVALLIIFLSAGCGSQSAPMPTSPPPSAGQAVAAHEPPMLEDSSEELTETELPVVASEPDVLYRPDDQRPMHDRDQLASVGIHCYESKRIRLYTDIEPDIARTLPPLVDQLYDALVEYFGPLPPDRQRTEFQVTGYLIRDEELFREQSLMQGLPILYHGKHVANRFWMREQQHDYYRRHLLLHECTHCWMTFMPGMVPPVWYMEGMAEHFGTHRLRDDGTAEFRIMPTKEDDMEGWGRIESIRADYAAGRALTLNGVCELPHDAFFQPQAYAWSWALCHFLDSHPRYHKRFRELGQHLYDGQFTSELREAFAADQRELATEWTLFESQVQPDYDTQSAAIDFQAGRLLSEEQSQTVTISANRGWQDIGVRVEPGMDVEVTATGCFTLADNPKPWVSEPQGISVRYFQGQPLGKLMACVVADPSEAAPATVGTHALQTIPIGRNGTFRAAVAGRLLFRLNDTWDALRDNTGSVEITTRPGHGVADRVVPR